MCVWGGGGGVSAVGMRILTNLKFFSAVGGGLKWVEGDRCQHQAVGGPINKVITYSLYIAIHKILSS